MFKRKINKTCFILKLQIFLSWIVQSDLAAFFIRFLENKKNSSLKPGLKVTEKNGFLNAKYRFRFNPVGFSHPYFRLSA
jgi:hypothetical protein